MSQLLLPKVKEVVAALAEARNACGKLRGDEFDRADAEINRLQAELAELERQVPSPPRASDLVALAEIVRGGAEVDSDGRLVELDEPAAARLVQAVLEFGESRQGAA